VMGQVWLLMSSVQHLVDSLFDQYLIKSVIQRHRELIIADQKLITDESEQVIRAHVLRLPLQSALLQEEAQQFQGLQSDRLILGVEQLHDSTHTLLMVEGGYHRGRMLVHQRDNELEHVDKVLVFVNCV